MQGLIKPLFYYPARHIYKLLSDKEYRLHSYFRSRYGRLQRFTKHKINIYGLEFNIPDMASFLSTHEELFVNQIYKLPQMKSGGIIVDVGANIGLSILYFKQNYPQAKIFAYEADKNIFEFLKSNIHGNGFSDVELFNQAVWHRNETLKFFSEGADGGRIQDSSSNNSSFIEVEAIDALDILAPHEKIYFLKIDIEGAERYVLPRIANELDKVENIFVEYHSEANQKQCLREIIDILDNGGFRLYIQPVLVSKNPFTTINEYDGFDLQLNIFGRKK